MAKRVASHLSVADLERMLAAAKKEIEDLQEERESLSARLARIDQRLAVLAGTSDRPVPGGSGRAPVVKVSSKPMAAKGKKPGRKKMAMWEHVAKILLASRDAVSPAEIAAALRKKGVSTAKTLATQVNQILRSGKVKTQKMGRGRYLAADNA